MKNRISSVLRSLILLTLSAATLAALVSCGGEELAFGRELVRYDSQLDTLIALDNGSIDMSVIDSVMAGYYASTGDYAGKIAIIEGIIPVTETYGIAGRKEDRSLIGAINDALLTLRQNGTYARIAGDFGLSETLSITDSTENPIRDASDTSLADAVASGKLIIGYTVFAPIAFTEGGMFTGFDVELAREVSALLGVAAEFQLIDWDAKESLLDNGTIDLIWNGLTVTDEREENMCISIPYLYNRQVAVVRAADRELFTDTASMADAVIGVESGSAGEDAVLGK